MLFASPRARAFAFACLPLLVAASGCESDDSGADNDGEQVDPSTDNGVNSGDIDAGKGSPAKPGIDAGQGKPGSSAGDAGELVDAADVENSTVDGSVADVVDAGAALDAASAAVDAGAPDGASARDAGRRDGGRADAGAASGSRDAGAGRCGSRGSARCGDDQFCNYEPDTECGATDRGGVCQDRPELCTQQYQPVCGCDNRTYGNACGAHAEGVSVQHEGECDDGTVTRPRAAEGEMCAGIAGIACEDGLFCSSEPEAPGDGCENIADGAGTCVATPRGCTREYQPVCGCDHHTYSNVCEAHRAGVSVLRTDECTELDCEQIGGQVVTGFGPPARCTSGTVSVGPVRFSSGQIAIEGALCCVSR
jgi:hypothetical protein